MNQSEMLARFVRETGVDLVLLAGRYTLLDQGGLDELLPLCSERGVAVLAGGVLNSGILAGAREGATYDYAPAPAPILERARRLEEVCTRHGVPLPAAALQFPLGHPAVSAIAIGARSAAEVTENLRLLRLPIPPALWEELRTTGLLRPEVPLPPAGGLWS
jgi:D-threo-aldose 1-dehydrogenase